MRLTLKANTVIRLSDLLNVPDAPDAALAGAGAGNVDNGTHVYAVTFVSANAQGGVNESAAGPISAPVTTTGGNGQVNLTNVPLGPTGTTKRKVYRSKAGTTTPLFLQQTINDNTTTAPPTDNTADASLTTSPPPNDTRSGIMKNPGYYPELTLGIPLNSANTGPIYVDQGNPNVSANNFGDRLEAGGTSSVTYKGSMNVPVEAGDVWMFHAEATPQHVNLSGDPL